VWGKFPPLKKTLRRGVEGELRDYVYPCGLGRTTTKNSGNPWYPRILNQKKNLLTMYDKRFRIWKSDLIFFRKASLIFWFSGYDCAKTYFADRFPSHNYCEEQKKCWNIIENFTIPNSPPTLPGFATLPNMTICPSQNSTHTYQWEVQVHINQRQCAPIDVVDIWKDIIEIVSVYKSHEQKFRIP